VIGRHERVGGDFECNGFGQIENAGFFMPRDDAKFFITRAALARLQDDLSAVLLPEYVEMCGRLIVKDAPQSSVVGEFVSLDLCA
jgi:hypothetical protein